MHEKNLKFMKKNIKQEKYLLNKRKKMAGRVSQNTKY